MRLFLFPFVAMLAAVAQDAPQQAPSSGAPPPVGVTQPQPAQGNDGKYTMQVSTRIVVLDVVATDAKGNVVSGLTKDDFHVAESDEPQTITNFDVGTKRLPTPEVDVESTADLDRLAPSAPVNIILLDEFNTRFEDEAFAQYSLKKYLEKQPDHMTTPTMLIAVGIDKFDVLRDYTQNKQLLLDALKHHFAGNPWRSTSNSWAPERFGTAFLTLRRVSEAVIGHQGHKNMIWIGRGFPALHWSSVPVDQTNRVETLRQQCINELRAARVTLTTIDPAGLLVDPGVYGEAARFNDPFGGEYQFAELAKATGGRTIYGRNDVDVQIGAAADEGTNFYTLVYHPTNTSRDMRQFRRIKVTVDRPGVTLSSSQGYYLLGRPAPVNAENPNKRLMLDLAAAADSKMAYDGAEVKVLRSPADPNSFQVMVAARSLVWSNATAADPKRYTDLVVVTTTFDKKGKMISDRARQLKFTAPGNVSPTGRIEMPLNFPLKAEVEPKATRVRFVVRVSSSGRIGTADIDLTQPVADAKPAAAPVQAAQP